MKINSLLSLCLILLSSEFSFAVTCHIDMTPEIAGPDAVVMKPIDEHRTTFTIRTAADTLTNADSKHPFVRRGILSVYSEKGRVMRSEIAPWRNGKELLYVFELDNDFAKRSRFELTEFEDNGQVGGGSISSYRLLDFIDPQHRHHELIQHLRIPRFGESDATSNFELFSKDEPSDE